MTLFPLDDFVEDHAVVMAIVDPEAPSRRSGRSSARSWRRVREGRWPPAGYRSGRRFTDRGNRDG
jgi:hypothetical protein